MGKVIVYFFVVLFYFDWVGCFEIFDEFRCFDFVGFE